jgi:hypothetical protein
MLFFFTQKEKLEKIHIAIKLSTNNGTQTFTQKMLSFLKLEISVSKFYKRAQSFPVLLECHQSTTYKGMKSEEKMNRKHQT